MTIQPATLLPERLAYRVTEAGDLVGVSRTTAYQLVASGDWPTIRIGRAVRVTADGLREWVRRNALRAAASR
jgi:excisionase family DNA binding protein